MTIHYRVVLNEDRSDALCQRIPIFEESGNLTIHISKVTCKWCLRKIAKMQRKESSMTIQKLDSNEMLHMQKDDYDKNLDNEYGEGYKEGYTEGRRELAEHVFAVLNGPARPDHAMLELYKQLREILDRA